MSMSVYAYLIFLAIMVLFMVYVFTQWRIKNKERYMGYICALKNGGISVNSHHQEDVFNISRTVQGQEQQNPEQNAYLSVDHITITNQMNKPNYDDAPPSYDEAMRIAVSQSSGSSEIPTVVVIPKTITV